MRRFLSVAVVIGVIAAAGMAIAGSAGQPPGGDSGSSGPEPELFALILMSLVPGIFFARRALAARNEAEETV